MTRYIDGFSSDYEDLIPYLPKEGGMPKLIVEVGTFNGGGTLFLAKSFPHTNIVTFEKEDPFEPEFVQIDQLKEVFKDFPQIELRIETSPPNEFEKEIDVCFIDIGSKFERNLNNFLFWFPLIKSQGVLLMLIPRNNEIKRESRKLFLAEVEKMNVNYIAYDSWIIFYKQ